MNDSNMSGDAVLIGFNHSDRVSALECALSDISRESRDRGFRIDNLESLISFRDTVIHVLIQKIKERGAKLLDRDQEIALLKTTIKGFEAALELANEEIERYKARLGFTQSITSDWEKTAEQLREERDRKIEILEDNLNHARSEHLEQLRAVIQMLQPLIGRPYNSTEQKDGKTYVHVNYTNEFTHNEKNSAIKLIQKVIYANIKRLDPCLTPTSYDDDF